MAKKKAEPEEEEEEEEVFHVEVILAARVADDIEGLDDRSAWEYLVKWYGYDDEEDNTWEPHDNISATCDRLLTSFWDQFKKDQDDYPPGYTLRSSENWIKKEKKFFRTILKEPDETPLTREQEEKILPNSRYERKGKSSSSAKSKRETLTGHDKPRSGSVLQKKRKRSISSSTDSDVPLSKKVAKKPVKSPALKNINTKSDDADDAARLFASDDVPSSAVSRPEGKLERSASTSRPKLKLDISTNATLSARSSPALNSAASRPSSMKPSPSIPQRSTPALPHMKTPATSQSATPVISQSKTPIISQATPTVPQAKPSEPKIRPHRQPGRVKELSFSDIPGGQGYSGLSTKQKVILASSKPTSSDNVAGFKPTPLPPISFKKLGQGAPTIGQDSSTSSPTSAAPLSASTPTIPFKGAPTFPPFKPLPSRKPTDFSYAAPTSAELAAEADQLLNDIGRDMGNSLPEDDYGMPHDDSWPPPEPLPTQKVLPKIPRIFKWEGDLYCSSGGSERSYGRVALSELATGHAHADSMKLDQAFPRKMASLKLPKFYHTSNILRQLRLMKDRSRFAALKALDQASRNAILVLANYAAKHSLAAVRFTEATFENNVEGLLVFFPPSSPLLTGLRVLPQLPPDTLMVVAVISRIAPTPVPTRTPPKLVPSRYLFPNHPHKHPLQRSIEILKFPLWLHAYLSKRPRCYCVWSNFKPSTKPPRIEHSKSGDKHETKMLRGILQRYAGQDVGLKKDVNLVFVHVSAVKSLHKLPAYVERIWKRVDVMFVMYGTHYNVPSSSWSMKRIYRSGGIVTFSPEGFLEDPLGVYNTCCDIARHQFWAVRVIPSVLGMLVRKYYVDNDSALLALDNDDFVYDFVVNAIDEGKFSFGRMPTVGPSWTRTKSENWLAEQALVLSGGPRSILEHALREFDAQYANIPQSDYIRVVHDSIAEEVRLSQLHPTIMEEYRRYVVLGTEKEMKTYTSDSFEYRTPPSFEFNYKSSKSHPQPS